MEKPTSTSNLPIPLLIFLFVRIPLLLALPFDGLRGYGDLLHFFNLAMIPGLPYIHYWIEFPPAFAFLNELVYFLAGGAEHSYTYLLVFLLLAADIGSVLLFNRLEKLLYPDEATGAAQPTWRSLIYAALLAGLPYAWWYFDSLAVFFTLLAINLAFTNRRALAAGAALGMGILLKLFPALLIPALVRTGLPARSLPNRGLSRHRPAAMSAAALALFVAPYLVLYILSPEYTRATIASQSARGSTATVWAIIDGNYRAGGFGPLVERLDPAKAYTTDRKPPVISPYLALPVFGLAGLYFFLKSKLDTPRKQLAFYGLTLVIFFLWSTGWSPQWILHLIPVILLVLPLSPGLLLLATLVLVNLLEWPVLLSRGMFSAYPLTILLRLALLVMLGYLFYQGAREERVHGSRGLDG